MFSKIEMGPKENSFIKEGFLGVCHRGMLHQRSRFGEKGDWLISSFGEGILDLRDDPADAAGVVHATIVGGVAKRLVHGGGNIDVVGVAAHALVDGNGGDRLAVGSDAHGAATAAATIQDGGVDSNEHASVRV